MSRGVCSLLLQRVIPIIPIIRCATQLCHIILYYSMLFIVPIIIIFSKLIDRLTISLIEFCAHWIFNLFGETAIYVYDLFRTSACVFGVEIAIYFQYSVLLYCSMDNAYYISSWYPANLVAIVVFHWRKIKFLSVEMYSFTNIVYMTHTQDN